MRIGRGFFAHLLVLLGLGIAVAACTPDFRPMGPAIQEPELTRDAIIAADGARLPLRAWPATGESQAVILALHGFTDYSNAFALPAAAWSTVGITTYAYDQRGFGGTVDKGRWAGSETYLTDVRTAVDVIREQHPDKPLFLLGESMGGSIAVLALTYEAEKPYNTDYLILPEEEPAPPIVDGLILIAPGILDRPSLSGTERAFLDFGVNFLPWAMSGRRGITVWPTDNRALLQQMGQDPLIQREVRFDQVYGLLGTLEEATQSLHKLDLPTLALFGGKDEILPPNAPQYFAKETFSQIARGVVVADTIPDAFHMLLRDRDAAGRQERVGAWVLEQAAMMEQRSKAIMDH